MTHISETATLTGALSGDVSGELNSTSVIKVNGASVPTSKILVGTNSSGQLVDASSATIANNTTGTAANITGVAAVANGGAGGDGSTVNQTGNFTFALTNAGRITKFNSASAIAGTIPPNSSVAFPLGTVLTGIQYGAGAASWLAGSGVTLRTASTLNFPGQWCMSHAVQIATDEWVVTGVS